MTVAQLVIGPVVVMAAFLGVIAFIIARLAAVKIRAARTVLRSDASWLAQYERDRDVLASVISELGTHPATYSTFPPDLREALYAAHESARDLERKSH